MICRIDQFRKPSPPISLADLPSDMAIIEAALRRLCGIARPLSTGDLADPATRTHYFLLRARANALDALGRVAR